MSVKIKIIYEEESESVLDELLKIDVDTLDDFNRIFVYESQKRNALLNEMDEIILGSIESYLRQRNPGKMRYIQ